LKCRRSRGGWGDQPYRRSPTLKIPGPESPELLAWLRERAINTHERLQTLEDSVNRDRGEHERGTAELETALRLELRLAIAESEGAYRDWRLVGLALAIVGLTLTLVGSLLPT
jgi:hypothetical protein